MNQIIQKIKKIERGFLHIIDAGDIILSDKTQNHFILANNFLCDSSYQVRMLGTYLLGQLSPYDPQALIVLKTNVGKDQNWRVQEMLAKAFDHYCKINGYKKSLQIIEEWLSPKIEYVKKLVEK